MENRNSNNKNDNSVIQLRDVIESDLDLFFDHQQNKTAQNMAAFISKDPSDRKAFNEHWNKIMNDPEVIIRTILYNKIVVGHIAKFVMFGDAELTYWIDRKYWGKGIATCALKELEEFIFSNLSLRRIEIRAAKENIASQKIALKCGYKKEGLLRQMLYVENRWHDCFLYSKIV